MNNQESTADGMMSDKEQWVEAGRPVPVAADPVDSGECSYDGCENSAEFLVQWTQQDGRTSKLARCCDECNRKHCIWARDIIDFEVDRDVTEVGGGSDA